MSAAQPEPPPPASGDEREDQAAVSGAEAAAILAAATAAILAAMAAAIGAVVAGTLTWQMARRRIRRTVAGLLGHASAQLGPVWQQAAREARAGGERAGQPGPLQGGRQAGPSGLPPGAHSGSERGRGPSRLLPDAPEQVAKAILNAQQDAGEAFDAAMYAALGGKGGALPPGSPYREAVEKAMRRLTGIGEDVKDLTGPERAALSLSRLQAAQHVMDDLAGKGLTGFTDSAGRRWSLDAYAEMATRTAASRMHLSSQLSMMAQAGNDLVIVDNPGMTPSCPRCLPWEGAVLSLSGNGTGASTITDADGIRRAADIKGSLAEAVAAGLMHPQCRHSLSAWAEGAGAVATAGGKERGYVQDGQPISRALPIGSPQAYKDEQRLRAHERNVRRAQMRLSGAVTPKAKTRARAHLAHARSGLEAHVRATDVTRLRGREKAGKAR